MNPGVRAGLIFFSVIAAFIMFLIAAVGLSSDWKFDPAHVITLGFFVLLGLGMLGFAFGGWLSRHDDDDYFQPQEESPITSLNG